LPLHWLQNNDPGIDQREVNQQNRINQGVQRWPVDTEGGWQTLMRNKRGFSKEKIAWLPRMVEPNCKRQGETHKAAEQSQQKYLQKKTQ